MAFATLYVGQPVWYIQRESPYPDYYEYQSKECQIITGIREPGNYICILDTNSMHDRVKIVKVEELYFTEQEAGEKVKELKLEEENRRVY